MPRRLTIVKIGGSVLDEPSLRSPALDAFAAASGRRILVHGGGKAADALAARLGVPQTKHDGRRVTDEHTLEIAQMVYAGLENTRITAELRARGCNALGINGADAGILTARRRPSAPVDFGHVGDVDASSVNVEALEALLRGGLLPVFSAVTHDGAGHVLNTNADDIAGALAAAMAPFCSVRLVCAFERAGVLGEPRHTASVLPFLLEAEAEALTRQGRITEGMVPKVRAAFNALHAGAVGAGIVHAARLADAMKGDAHGGTVLAL